MNPKELLLEQLHDAFEGDDEMSFKASLGGLTPQKAAWRLNDTTWTIEEILYHVASCEIEYCRQGFDLTVACERTVGDPGATLALLDRAHALLTQCLQACREEDLGKPIPTQLHGQSAAHFFGVMVMHRVSHAAQIRTIRRAFGSRTDFYPI